MPKTIFSMKGVCARADRTPVQSTIQFAVEDKTQKAEPGKLKARTICNVIDMANIHLGALFTPGKAYTITFTEE